ncbi:SMP-30/gluconolactonase/LRE family protein [Novosphingobium mangrovi (ex Huang et al. 2023)]|uniref:SMP-30/gluconolactonase/LRE family protein n=1 Tax=Novosphingobium mangrovi (ex Huang et al. 2023) TaxID=2976432 RepID=A0ABT2I5L1_9SPHN|nr:SMP-30/gluconolactonase/LRE family protein [Novosphingobium mangrovi (ex Huang et al. 2023)]MCT2399883.1 SMP-30/gluconolactonase/LRE family protein [Novosphingobium mangrovi (ex Huang et al. 2023)]
MGELAAGAYEKIAEGVYLEGLSYDFTRDVIWYSDVIKGGIHGVKPDGTPVATLDAERMWTGGVMMNSCGAVLSTGQGGIRWNNPDTGKSGWLIEELEGKPVNGINEMWPDGTGGIFFGTNDIEYIIEARDTRPSAIYRLTADRHVIKLSDKVYFSNGIAYDPGRRRFYCSDTFRTSWVWDVADDLTLSNQRVLFDKEDCDGMAMEADGTLLITGFRSPGKILRVSPEGKELAPLPTPAGSATQIRFGGSDLRDVYINVVPADGGDSLKEGRPLAGASCLYKGRSERPGTGVAASNFRLG